MSEGNPKTKGKRKRGGQPGHKGYSRKLYPLLEREALKWY